MDCCERPGDVRVCDGTVGSTCSTSPDGVSVARSFLNFSSAFAPPITCIPSILCVFNAFTEDFVGTFTHLETGLSFTILDTLQIWPSGHL